MCYNLGVYRRFSLHPQHEGERDSLILSCVIHMMHWWAGKTECVSWRRWAENQQSLFDQHYKMRCPYEPEDEKETTATGSKPTRTRSFPTAPTRAAPANSGTP